MKQHNSIKMTIFIGLLATGFIHPAVIMAQDDPPGGSPVAAADPAPDTSYSSEELQQMVAPIALYPDELLTQVLMASTYPLEVVEGDRWMQDHKKLMGDALKSELTKQSWDDSVKALTSTPDVLATMSKNLEWTQKLGDAVLAQQDDVMNAVQALRTKAYKEENLTSNQQQTVNVVQAPSASSAPQTIIIESAQPDTVYVPYYNPTVVYGAWSYPSYPPPYYPPPPGYAVASGLAGGIAFAAGVAVFDDWWDDDFDWGHHDIDIDINDNRSVNIDRDRINNFSRPGKDGGGTQWKHDPAHRHGVPYDNRKLDQKFSPKRTQRADTSHMRNDFRGKLDQTPHPGQARRNPQPAGRPNLGGQTHRTADPGSRAQNNRPNFDSVNRSGLRSNESAFSNIGSGRAAQNASSRGRASVDSSRGSRGQIGGGAGRAGGGHIGGGLRR